MGSKNEFKSVIILREAVEEFKLAYFTNDPEQVTITTLYELILCEKERISKSLKMKNRQLDDVKVSFDFFGGEIILEVSTCVDEENNIVTNSLRGKILCISS
jgi:hypothetical protein